MSLNRRQIAWNVEGLLWVFLEQSGMEGSRRGRGVRAENRTASALLRGGLVDIGYQLDNTWNGGVENYVRETKLSTDALCRSRRDRKRKNFSVIHAVKC